MTGTWSDLALEDTEYPNCTTIAGTKSVGIPGGVEVSIDADLIVNELRDFSSRISNGSGKSVRPPSLPSEVSLSAWFCGIADYIEAIQAHCAEQDEIIKRLDETITIRGQRLAVLSGDNVRLESEKAGLEKLVYVPGLWRCAKCDFELIQANLNANDGTVTARDQPGDKCPNCKSSLWRVTERQSGETVMQRLEEMCHEKAQQQEWFANWRPTAENINALPEKLRQFVADLETQCDPAGMVAENTLVKDNCRMLEHRYLQQQERIAELANTVDSYVDLVRGMDEYTAHLEIVAYGTKSAAKKEKRKWAWAKKRKPAPHPAERTTIGVDMASGKDYSVEIESKANNDEMTFVLLARDAAAPAAIRAWVRKRVRLGKNDYSDGQITEALDCADAMERQRAESEGNE